MVNRIKPFVLFSLIMILKIYLTWLAIFDGMDDMRGFEPILREIPFIWIIFCLIEWFSSKRKLGLYLVTNLVVTSVFFAAIMYHKYFGVIVDYRALQQVNQVTAVKNSIFSLLSPQYLLFFLDIVVIGIWLMNKNRAKKLRSYFNLGRAHSYQLLTIFVLSFGLCLFNVWPNRASMNEIKQAEQMGILNYETYAIFTKDKVPIIDADEITQTKINEIKGINISSSPVHYGVAKGKNVIMIQLESFQNFLINLNIDGQEITPHLNQLVKDSIYFPNFYQMVGQGNTSDAEFVVNTSFYIPNNEAATQSYPDKELLSLPKLLQAQGYETATFHTNVVNFWNRKELYDAIGFDRVYDQQFFGKEDTVFFGPSDEVLYTKTLEELETIEASGKPFYSHIISMTAHHPFTIPEDKKLISLPARYQDNMVGEYIVAQHYADGALGQFITDLKTSGLWDNSIIVIYGDHLGLPQHALDKHGHELMNEIYGYEYSYKDMINIPLIISIPDAAMTTQSEHRINQLSGHIDIAPTVANLLGVSMDNQIHFGQDLFNQSTNLLPQRYYLPSGSFLNEDTLFIPGSDYHDGVEYSLTGENNKQAVTTTKESEYERALELLNLSDSYIRQLPDR